MAKVTCTECGHEIDLVKEDGFIAWNLPACEKCKNKYWKVSGKKSKRKKQ